MIIGPSYSDNFTLDLNYQTIYCTADIQIPKEVTFTGSGCVIAKGDIDFKPKMSSSPEDFVFVMSEEGTVHFEPQGDFYGSLAGNVEISLWPGNTLTLTEVPRDEDGNYKLNFPFQRLLRIIILLQMVWIL